MMAAGVAFYFLLGLIPFLFITTAVAALVFRRNPAAFDAMSTNLLNLLPPGWGDRTLQQLVGAVESWHTLGLIGVVSLFLVAMGLFEALSWGINGAMGQRRQWGFIKGRAMFIAWVAGAIGFFALAAVADYGVALVLQLPQLEHLADRVPRRGPSMAVFAIALTVLYRALPVQPPRLWRALIGAIAVAALWSWLQITGANITAAVTRRQAIYGALAGGAVFLTWMYLLAVIVLAGATVLERWQSISSKPAADGDEAG